MKRLRTAATIAFVALGLWAQPSLAGAAAPAPSQGERTIAKPSRLDRSGRPKAGKASLYGPKFAGRRMADGARMRPDGNNAASKTLPLGTTARVTNLETGQSAEVVIRDRGPHVPGRIIDLSPATAEEIGLTRKQGVARVEVAPIAVPLPDGTVKPGAAAQ